MGECVKLLKLTFLKHLKNEQFFDKFELQMKHSTPYLTDYANLQTAQGEVETKNLLPANTRGPVKPNCSIYLNIHIPTY